MFLVLKSSGKNYAYRTWQTFKSAGKVEVFNFILLNSFYISVYIIINFLQVSVKSNGPDMSFYTSLYLSILDWFCIDN